MADRDPDTQSETAKRIPIWDRPTRVFHWVLAILFVVCFVSGRNGQFDIHIPAGQALLVLVVARILWGLVGSETSQLAGLVRSPATILAYIRTVPRREPDRYGGHNPLGGLSVVAMLALLLLQTGLGLFAADVDGLHEGPLSFLVSYDLAREASELHAIVVDILLGLVGLHLAAILFHLIYKRRKPHRRDGDRARAGAGRVQRAAHRGRRTGGPRPGGRGRYRDRRDRAGPESVLSRADPCFQRF